MTDDNQDVTLADDVLPAEKTEQSEAKTTADQAAEEAKNETGTTDDADAGKAEEQTEGDDDDQDEDKPKKKLSGSERLKRRLKAAEAELAELRSRAPQGDGVDRKAIEAEIGPEPKEAEYDDWFKYQRDLQAWDVKRVLAEERARERSAQRSTREAEVRRDLEEAFAERLQMTAKSGVIPDFTKVISSADIRLAPHVEALILESEKGDLLAYHLAKHPNKANELNGMTALQAARQVGKLEAGLSRPNPNRATKAPAPISPPSGGASPQKSLSDMSMEEYAEYRRKQGI